MVNAGCLRQNSSPHAGMRLFSGVRPPMINTERLRADWLATSIRLAGIAGPVRWHRSAIISIGEEEEIAVNGAGDVDRHSWSATGAVCTLRRFLPVAIHRQTGCGRSWCGCSTGCVATLIVRLNCWRGFQCRCRVLPGSSGAFPDQRDQTARRLNVATLSTRWTVAGPKPNTAELDHQ